MSEILKKIVLKEKEEPKTAKLPNDTALFNDKDRQQNLDDQAEAVEIQQLRLRKHSLGGTAGLSQLSFEAKEGVREDLNRSIRIKLPKKLSQANLPRFTRRVKRLTRFYYSKKMNCFNKKLRSRISIRPAEIDMPNPEAVKRRRKIRRRLKKSVTYIFLIILFILGLLIFEII